ncbi:MAG: chemotaxis protein CheW [Spirochaetales bacterium]|nr:chemotaxis protein CheW [Spirochaetales bacterium]
MSSTLENARELGVDDEGILDAAKQQEKIDFKMVTFSLAGRQYAVNIMKVKEISKANRFTFVPNTLTFVEGVYNLRGEIITIIDLRRMFNLPPVPRANDRLENIIILNIRENVIGVIVDAIENVVGVSSRTIQPRHPLFTDIQMKYISGVVETGGKLYVILDVDRIFGEEEEAAAGALAVGQDPREPGVGTGTKPSASAEGSVRAQRTPEPAAKKAGGAKADDALDFQFVSETLAAFDSFHVDALNEAWVKSRLVDWKKMRNKKGQAVQLKDRQEALDFLDPFFSPHTGELWGAEYKKEFEKALWKGEMLSIKAWNPGTDKGYEAFSICAILKQRYPKARIKVWACDTNLLAISAAPLMVLDRDVVPEYFIKAGYVKGGAKGYQFTPEMRDCVLFEYHDILHGTTLPELDLIVARDVLSFCTSVQKDKLVADFTGMLKPGGILMVGTNERIAFPGLALTHEGNVVAYQKEKD